MFFMKPSPCLNTHATHLLFPADVIRMRVITLLMLLLMAVLMAAACGKKGPPLPPLREDLPAVADIDVRLEGDVLTLSWPLEPYRSASRVRPAGFRVYRAVQEHGDIECPECPPWFQMAADISFDAIADARPSAVYTQKLKTGYQYRFRVIPYMDDGTEDGPSDIITINR